MKLRPEVREALARWCNDPPCGDALCADEQIALLALVELGVRLGVAHACEPALCTAEDISQETVNDILQAQPGAEGGE